MSPYGRDPEQEFAEGCAWTVFMMLVTIIVGCATVVVVMVAGWLRWLVFG